MQRACAAPRKPASSATDLALDPHRQREGADLEVGDAAVEHLAHQVERAGTVERARAFAAATDLLDVSGDAHDLSPRRPSQFPAVARRTPASSDSAEQARHRLPLRRAHRRDRQAVAAREHAHRRQLGDRRASRAATSSRVFFTTLTSTWYQRGFSARRLGVVVMALRVELGRVRVGRRGDLGDAGDAGLRARRVIEEDAVADAPSRSS